MWNRQEISLPVFQALENVIRNEHARGRLPLPNFTGSNLVAASDYSGEHKASHYQVISCLVTSLESWKAWEQRRVFARHVQQVKDRKIRYSGLGDSAQARMLVPVLSGALSLRGVLFCMAVEKTLRSLIDPRGKIDLKHPDLSTWRYWKGRQFERMLRVASFVSILVVGLSRPNQSIFWITDEDEIAANQAQLERLASAFAGMVLKRAPHPIPTIECATTMTDTGNFELEDLVAISDLAGGALSDLLTEWKNVGVDWSSKLALPVPEQVPNKARPILEWFFRAPGVLTRALIVVFRGARRDDVTIKLIPLQ